MASDALVREPLTDGCRTIAQALGRHMGTSKETEQIREVLVRDLSWKLSQVEPFERTLLMAETCVRMLPADQPHNSYHRGEWIKQTRSLRELRRAQKDVAIITVRNFELEAVLAALGLDPRSDPSEERRSMLYWYGSIPRESGGDLSVVATMVGDVGQEQCAAAAGMLLGAYDVGLCVLVGIGAGLEGKVKHGDAIWGTQVVNYEYERLEEGGAVPAHRNHPVDQHIVTLLERYSPLDSRWRQRAAETVARLSQTPAYAGLTFDRISRAKYDRGAILAGAKFVGGTGVEPMRKKHHGDAICVDMEGGGLAAVCERAAVKWFVMRGVSDHGGKSRPSRLKALASASVAALVVDFLASGYSITPGGILGDASK